MMPDQQEENKMMNKFLSDGRKVAVLGKLNNAEYIVQEIFVTESGEEIPSGENFTVKSLHDAPVESYYKKEEARQKAYIKKAQDELESIHKKIKENNNLLKAKCDMLANSPEIKDLFGEKSRIISMFMTSTVNYLVVYSYRITAPVKMEDEVISWDGYYSEARYDGIKLCSVLGKSNRDIEYRIHQYSDGSGSCYTEVYPFETYEEAINKIHSLASEKISKDSLSKEEYEICKSLGIKFSLDEMERFFAALSKSISASVSNIKSSIDKEVARKAEMETQLSSLKEYVFGSTL
jgi:hypothetical protein